MSQPTHGARALTDLLRRKHGPAKVLVRARAHLKLQRQLEQQLPDELKNHARVACVRGKTLIMAADSPAWATRLRIYSNELLTAARKAWPEEINHLKAIVSSPPEG